MTKLLLITSEFPPQPGGIGAHAHNLAKFLTKNNFEVTVLTDMRSALGQEERNFDFKQAYKVKRIPRKKFMLLTYLKRIYSAVALCNKNDVILVSGKFSLWIGGLLSLISSKKIIGVVHGSEVAMPASFRKVCTKWCVRQLTVVIAVSKYTKSLIADWDLAHIEVIPNGFSLASAPVNGNKSLKPIRLITVGNVTERKGQQNVIKALPEILQKFPDAIYNIVGIPTEIENLLHLTKKLNVEHAVIFHGKVSEEEKIKLLQESTVFIMLSQTTATGDVEGFGIAILEANSVGVPAIGSKNCGIEDAISHNNSGILVDYYNSKAIVIALQTIIKEYDAYSNCAVTWSKQFVWDSVIKDYIKVVQL
ncbi:MAG: glycosyltransferase [Flavobacteriaceae bacterium]|nr:glycosyltransferase [Flavobacteriaceae bacterium]